MVTRGELSVSELCALRRAPERGVTGGETGLGFSTMFCDDLSMAALTVASIPTSLGRNVGGIWRSSWIQFSLIMVLSDVGKVDLPGVDQMPGSFLGPPAPLLSDL